MNSGQSDKPIEIEESAKSCVPAISRKEFVQMVLKRGAVAGAILAAPAIVDAFLAPPAVAMASAPSGTGGESGSSTQEP